MGNSYRAFLRTKHHSCTFFNTEIFVFRSLEMVQVYHVTSHGRRFYRVLEYTSNTKFTLRDMQPSIKDRQQPWPSWERHGAGHPYQDHWDNPLSCVITRGSEFPQNLSGGTETFVPERLLYGILPHALLTQYLFWQDEEDNLRGYPRDEKSPYLIEASLIDARIVECTLLVGVCGRVRRVMKKHREDRMKAIVEFVGHLGGTIVSTTPAVAKTGDEAQNSWKFGYKMMKRIGAIVDSCVPLSDLVDFVSALKESGVEYDDANLLVAEVEAYAAENGPQFASKSGLDYSPRPSQQTFNGAKPEGADTSLEQADLTLLNLAFACKETKFFSLLHTITRLETAGGILCWTLTDSVRDVPLARGSEWQNSINIDLLEIPRLKMSFQEQLDEQGVARLYSLDHVNLYVSNYRSPLTIRLMSGLPHSILMSTSNAELQILVPALDPVRPKIGTSPFSTGATMIHQLILSLISICLSMIF